MKRTSLALLVLGVLGSLTGYLRELAMATVFGAGRLTDVYFVAFSIPMVIGDLVIGSVLIACIIPVLSQLRDDDPDKPGFSFLNGALLLVAIFGILIASTVTAMMPILAALLAPGFDEPTLQLLLTTPTG